MEQSEYCESCGRKTNKIYKVEIEETIMEVCQECSSLGKIIVEKKEIKRIRKEPKTLITTEEISEDYNIKIKKARESKNLTIKDLALKINEKESLLHKIENKHIKPTLDLARKIENKLGIKIIEKMNIEENNIEEEIKEEPNTLGYLLEKAMKSKSKQ